MCGRRTPATGQYREERARNRDDEGPSGRRTRTVHKIPGS